MIDRTKDIVRIFYEQKKRKWILAAVLIQSHLVSISVNPIEVNDDGKLEKAGDIEDGEVELTCDFHDLHQEEDGPEVDVTQDGPDQEADAEDEA